MDGIEVSSAGTDAECPVSSDLLEWADQVFVMEQRQRRYLQTHFGAVLKDKKIVCLGVPDVYSYNATGVGRVASDEGDSVVAQVIRTEDLISL